ncbi:MAG: transposase [Pseudobacteriovorax sp.]|nr:transposase [Pseudobacteriovorax sp.]
MPIDNNSQERLLRSAVIGRKTWFGTHSKRGAKTAAILFSLIESCKIKNINPRRYFAMVIADLHAGKPGFSPHQAARDQLIRYKNFLKNRILGRIQVELLYLVKYFTSRSLK